jgi:hypothetical protein
MAARKSAADKPEVEGIELKAADDDAEAKVAADEEEDVDKADDEAKDDEPKHEVVFTKDVTGRVVAESDSGRKFSTLGHEVGDPTILQPQPGGPRIEAGIGLGHNNGNV